jgi:hypothetical protein
VIASLPGSLEGPGPQVSVVPFSLSLNIMSTILTHHMFSEASSPSAPKVTPPPPDTRPTDGSGSQQQESAEGGAGSLSPAAAKTAAAASHAPAGDPAAAAPVLGGVAAAEEVPAGGSVPTHDTGGDIGGASSSNPPPAPEEIEVVFGQRLRSSVEQEAAPVPLPRMLSCAHQILSDTGAAILREWEALEDEDQRLSDWRTQLEERTRTTSQQFISERSQLERDCKEYKRDLQRVCARELEASRREKKLTRREEAMTQWEALTTEC